MSYRRVSSPVKMKKFILLVIVVTSAWFGYRHWKADTKSNNKQLFQIEANYEKELNGGKIPPSLKQDFEKRGFPLTKKATIKVMKKNKRWLIEDEGRKYFLSMEKKNLSISIAAGQQLTFSGSVDLLDEGEETDGISLYKKKKFKEAVAQFEKNRENPRNIAHMAKCFEYMGEREKALQAWEELLKKFGDSPYAGDGYYFLAREAKIKDLAKSYRDNLEKAAVHYRHSVGGGLAARDLGDYFVQRKNKIEAWKWYSMAILGNYPQNVENIKIDLKNKLDSITQEFLLSKQGTAPFLESYKVKRNDNFSKIGEKYRLARGFVRWLNGRKSDTIHPNEKLKTFQGPIAIEISKKSFLLVVHLENPKYPPYYLKGYRVGLGKNSKTPVRKFIIGTRVPNPPWWSDEGLIPYGDPRHTIGNRWLGFYTQDENGEYSRTSFGIHGTIYPDSIGKNMSNGCVRMRNDEVEELFEMIPTPKWLPTNVAIKWN